MGTDPTERPFFQVEDAPMMAATIQVDAIHVALYRVLCREVERHPIVLSLLPPSLSPSFEIELNGATNATQRVGDTGGGRITAR